MRDGRYIGGRVGYSLYIYSYWPLVFWREFCGFLYHDLHIDSTNWMTITWNALTAILYILDCGVV